MKKFTKVLSVALLATTIFSCNQAGLSDEKETSKMMIYSSDCITEAEVVAAQKEWGEGIVNIGKVFTEKGDYKKAATDHIQNFYGYDLSSVLFKPTLASVEQFRGSFDSAHSYFVGQNESFPEDKGFAIKPWTNVRWENTGVINNSCTMAISMVTIISKQQKVMK